MAVPSLCVSSRACAPRYETLLDALERAAAADGPFCTFHGNDDVVELTYRGVLDGARRWCAALLDRGVTRGERVAVLTPTSPMFIQAFVGTQMAGAVPVPLPFALSMAGIDKFIANLAAIIANAGARVCIAGSEVRQALAQYAPLHGTLEAIVSEGEVGREVGHVPTLTRSVGGSDSAFIQYTSGTTGRPKGVVISQRALMANGFSIMDGAGLTEQDVAVSWLPMFHDMGLIGCLLMPLCHRLRVHFMTPAAFVMRPHRWLKLISDVGGTISPAPNFAYERCASRPMPGIERLDLRSWRVAMNGAEQVLPSTIARFTDRFAPVGFRPSSMTPVYGMAECTLAATFSDPGADPEVSTVASAGEERPGGAVGRLVSVGSPVAGMSIRVIDDGGATAPEGVIGQVEVSGPSLMDGYFQNEEASAAALHDGWLRTGDLGFVQGGKLHIAGRMSDMIIKAGRNLHPTDIERVAIECLGSRVRSVAAFARPNPETGTEDLVVAAETREQDPEIRQLVAATIRAEVLAALGVGVDSVEVCPVGVLPRTTSGKVRRRACAAALAELTSVTR